MLIPEITIKNYSMPNNRNKINILPQNNTYKVQLPCSIKKEVLKHILRPKYALGTSTT
jgi:hypothetical protein